MQNLAKSTIFAADVFLKPTKPQVFSSKGE